MLSYPILTRSRYTGRITMSKEHSTGAERPHNAETPALEEQADEDALERFITGLTEGALLETWAGLPYLQRLRVRLLIGQLQQAMDTLDPTLPTAPAADWYTALRAREQDVPTDPYATAFPTTVEDVIRDTGALPPPDALPEGTPLHAITREQGTVRTAYIRKVAAIARDGRLNPDFS